ncbi:MAG: LacI family DNA-binding transcriptional regulator [Opitutaceae bacterium]
MAVTMADIAQAAGVSKNAVSLALRHDDRISAPTRERIVKIAADLGYRKNPVMSHLMAELRRSQGIEFKRTLGLLNGYPHSAEIHDHPTLAAWLAGCRHRAAQQGYGMDEFWLYDKGMRPERLDSILSARGIRGIILVGTFRQRHMPEKWSPIWETRSCVLTGVRTESPRFSYSCVDHHALIVEAVNRVVALGYRRPGLVVDKSVDLLVDGRFSAGFAYAQRQLPPSDRVPWLSDQEKAWEDPGVVDRWLEKHRPDVILTLHINVRRWLEERGYRVPRDMGLVLLERRLDAEGWAAMDQHNDEAGEAAVDIMIRGLQNGEVGVPAHPRAILITATWMMGNTVLDRRAVPTGS